VRHHPKGIEMGGNSLAKILAKVTTSFQRHILSEKNKKGVRILRQALKKNPYMSSYK